MRPLLVLVVVKDVMHMKMHQYVQMEAKMLSALEKDIEDANLGNTIVQIIREIPMILVAGDIFLDLGITSIIIVVIITILIGEGHVFLVLIGIFPLFNPVN